jgi:hypothetical protein
MKSGKKENLTKHRKVETRHWQMKPCSVLRTLYEILIRAVVRTLTLGSEHFFTQ